MAILIKREVHERVNVRRLDDNYTIQFQQKRYWQYVEEMSNGSLNDPITNLNVPFLVIFKMWSTLELVFLNQSHIDRVRRTV